MFSESIAVILSNCCLAFITVGAVGGLFAAGLTLGSRHIRWLLQLAVTATGHFILHNTTRQRRIHAVAASHRHPAELPGGAGSSPLASPPGQGLIDLCWGAVLHGNVAFAESLLIFVLPTVPHHPERSLTNLLARPTNTEPPVLH